MRGPVTWVVRNGPAVNALLVALLIAGVWALTQLRSETFPEFQLDQVKITVPYPGASPSEVEEGICQKIEEAIRAVDGVKKVSSVAQEGSGTVVAELHTSVDDTQAVLNDIRSEVDRIPSFPLEAEDPEIQLLTARSPTIRVVIYGGGTPPAGLNEAEYSRWREDQQLQLREMAEEVREDLLDKDSISSVEILAARQYQIDVELPEAKLREHNLTLRQVADNLRRENIELPGGTIKTAASDYLVRGMNKRTLGEQIAELPVTDLAQPDGSPLKIGDLGHVDDAFADDESSTWVWFSERGEKGPVPAIALVVQKTASEDLLQIARDVREYVAEKQLRAGFSMRVYDDSSQLVRERLDTLIENGILGLILVFVVLSLFLEFRLAFWVALGIPISLAGAFLVMNGEDQTLNMVTTFAFLLVLGILVDDAIVVGENVYRHREMGKPRWKAAIDGTSEVASPIIASVLTTVLAFLPMFFVVGTMGKIIVVMPIVVISALLFSLGESLFILPNHLAHGDPPPEEERDAPRRRTLLGRLSPLRLIWRGARWLFGPTARYLACGLTRTQKGVDRGLGRVVDRGYLPALRWCIRQPWVFLSMSVGVLIMCVGLIVGGFTPFIVFPKLDSILIQASVKFPNGTPIEQTEQAAARMAQAIQDLNHEWAEGGREPVTMVLWTVGYAAGQRSAAGGGDATQAGHVAEISVELIGSEDRQITSDEMLAAWRERIGRMAGAEEVKFFAGMGGPGGKPIEFQLVGSNMKQLEAAVEEAKEHLRGYQGVFDIVDNSLPGKPELQLRVRPQAQPLGIDTNELARTVRSSFYGEEVMRLQRGRHEVKLMVRYPAEERESLGNLKQIRVRVGGREVPLEEIAEIKVRQGYSEINRVDQKRSITISADVDESQANAQQIVSFMKDEFVPALLQKYSGVQVRWEGQERETQESFQSLVVGFIGAMFGMYLLLTIQFRSYVQPFIVLAVIPFGLVGAILGHFAMGMMLTMFSFFGIVALSGVVINDSIVLIDFINARLREGRPLEEALQEAGRQRFRPVLLTSVTTIVALLPILLESSLQVQILIPMATSLAFGLMVATVWVLLLVPSIYSLYGHNVKPSAVEDAEENVRTMKAQQEEKVEVLTS